MWSLDLGRDRLFQRRWVATSHYQLLTISQLMWTSTLIDELGYLNLRPEQTDIFSS